MSECRGPGCTHSSHVNTRQDGNGVHFPHPAELRSPQYGTGLHYPNCIDGNCNGCLPDLNPPAAGPAAPPDPAPPAKPALEQLVDELADPIVKYDGRDQPVRVSQMGNRRQRRDAMRQATRAARKARTRRR